MDDDLGRRVGGACRLPVAFDRKKAKKYGTAELAEGADLSARDLRERGAPLLGALCVIDRSGGQHQLDAEDLDLIGLFTADDLG